MIETNLGHDFTDAGHGNSTGSLHSAGNRDKVLGNNLEKCPFEYLVANNDETMELYGRLTVLHIYERPFDDWETSGSQNQYHFQTVSVLMPANIHCEARKFTPLGSIDKAS